MHCRRHKQNDMREQECFERDLLFFHTYFPKKAHMYIERIACEAECGTDSWDACKKSFLDRMHGDDRMHRTENRRN